MKKYIAKVESLGSEIEEEVFLTVDGLSFLCFASICPYEIKEGGSYPVSFELMVFEEYDVEALNKEDRCGLERAGQDFSYWVKGPLSGAVIDCGISFEDEVLLEYSYLDGKNVRLKVDRIDVEFLEE